jgi:hypothetical protein
MANLLLAKSDDLQMTDSPMKSGTTSNPPVWSSSVVNCFIIDSDEATAAEEKKVPYTGGVWKPTLFLCIELKASSVLPISELLKTCRQVDGGPMRPMYHANTPLIFITSHPEYYGMWKLSSAHDKFIYCEVSPYTTTWEPNKYSVNYDSERGGNVCITLPPSEKAKVNIDASKAKVFFAPPLRFHIRSTVFSMDDIQTAAQTFRTSVFIELRLRSICTGGDLVHHLMKDYGFHISMFEVMNVVEHTSDIEKWENAMRVDDNNWDYSFKYRYNSVLGEEFELGNFPFDLQDLSILATLNLPSSRAELIPNEEYPSIFHRDSFRLSSIYTVTHGEQVHTTASLSLPSESSAGHTYPRVQFVMNLTRKQGYYAWNIALPMAVLTALTALSIGVQESDGSRLSTGDRLQITLTLLLTSVAFKFVVAESLPRVSYQTTIDKYILLCNGFICVAAIENVMYPALTYDKDGKESLNEWYVMIMFLVCFGLANLVFWVVVDTSFKQRVKDHELKSQREHNRRSKYAVSTN